MTDTQGSWLRPPAGEAHVDVRIPEGVTVSDNVKAKLDALIAAVQQDYPQGPQLEPEATCQVVTMRPCYVEWTCRIV